MELQSHPASEDELFTLKVFEGAYEEIVSVIQNNQDIATGWLVVGIENYGERKRVLLMHNVTLALAYVVGDGVHFGLGPVVAPTREEMRKGMRGVSEVAYGPAPR